MNAISQNDYTKAWREIGKSIPRPKAMLVISAHWYLPGTFVTAMEKPRTIHDFGGFPRELFEFSYPAPGHPELARRVQQLLNPLSVGLDVQWGLDHGTWSVLCHVFPKADIPVVQLSIDETQPAQFHYEMGKRLAPLRDEGILIVASGNVVHNLHTYAWGKRQQGPYDWATRFEQKVKTSVCSGNHEPLINYEDLGPDALLSVPTPDHYLPLLYVLGASNKGDSVTFPVEGVDGGSISMLTVKWEALRA